MEFQISDGGSQSKNFRYDDIIPSGAKSPRLASKAVILAFGDSLTSEPEPHLQKTAHRRVVVIIISVPAPGIAPPLQSFYREIAAEMKIPIEEVTLTAV
jgi:hypothetical protein